MPGKPLLVAVAVVAVALSLLITKAAPRALPGERLSPPLTILLNDWHSQQVFSYIVGQLLEQRGQAVEYLDTDTVLQFDALANGDGHFQVAVWHNRMADDFERALDRGVIHAGEHPLRFSDGWWVSDATLAACPDAAQWDGLVACAQRQAGATPGEGEASGQPLIGRFEGPPATFDRDYTDRVSRLRMPFSVEVAGSLDALRASWAAFDAETGLPDGAPIRAVYNWSPNTLGGPVNGQFVRFPEPRIGCFRDPGWGPNPDDTGDCGDPDYFPVSKAAWAGVLDSFPDSWALLKAVEFDSTDYRQILDWMSAPSAEPRSVARRWIAANADRIEAWP